MSTIKISGREANTLLYALDEYFEVDENGKLQDSPKYTWTDSREKVQELRDRLFNAHEHGEDA